MSKEEFVKELKADSITVTCNKIVGTWKWTTLRCVRPVNHKGNCSTRWVDVHRG